MPVRLSHVTSRLRSGTGASSSIWLISAQLGYVALGYLLTVGLARELSVSEFGVYALVLTISTWVNIVAANGIPQVTTQRLAAAPGSAGSVWRSALRLQIVFSVGLALAMVLISPLIARILGQASLTVPIALGSLALPGVAIISLQLGRLSSSLAFRRQALVQITWNVLRTGGALAAAALGGLDAALLAIALSAIPGIVIAGRARYQDSQSARHTGLLRAAAGTSLVGLLLVVLGSYDLIVVTGMLPNEAGLYAAAQNLARIPLYLAIPLAVFVLPHAARHTLGSDRLRRELELALVVITLPAAVILAQPHVLITLVFGSRFAAADGVVAILAVALALLGIAMVASSVLIGTGERRLPALIAAASLAAGACVIVPLVMARGAEGAAWSTAIAAGVATTLSAIVLLRSHPTVIRRIALWRVMAAAAGTFVVAWAPGLNPMISLSAAIVAGLVLVRLFGLPPFGRNAEQSIH